MLCSALLYWLWPAAQPSPVRSLTYDVAREVGLSQRDAVLAAYPELLPPLMDGFGGDFSRAIAQNIFAATDAGVAAAHELTYVQSVRPGLWLIRMPLVNAVLVDVGQELLLIDAGMRAAGPALVAAIASVSSKPVGTLVFTHGHVDHAFGADAVRDAYPQVRVVAHERLPQRFERYIETRGLLARLMSQPAEQMPRTKADFVWPDETFSRDLELRFGEVSVQLFHYPAETDDQLFVWLPQYRALASADYHQGFLPNAGNGKRVQRFVKEWIDALDHMQQLSPEILLPGHGQAVEGEALVSEQLAALRAALHYIRGEVIARLNAGARVDQATHDLQLPGDLAERADLALHYVTPEDIGRMVARRYTGWWSEIASDWSPAPKAAQAQDLVGLMGGIDAVLNRSQALFDKGELQRASHLVDLCRLAQPTHQDTLHLAIAVYRARLLDADALTQERLVYLDEIAAARALLD